MIDQSLPLARGPRIRSTRISLSLLTLALSLSPTGCSGPDPATTIHDVDDPAMAGAAPGEGVRESTTGRMVEEVRTADPAPPEGPYLNETGTRIFIPSLGWMSTGKFMDMYENRPEQLPDDLDLHAIHKIRARLASSG